MKIDDALEVLSSDSPKSCSFVEEGHTCLRVQVVLLLLYLAVETLRSPHIGKLIAC